MRLAIPLVLALLSSAVQAAVQAESGLPLSAYADTEAVTNVAFNAGGADDRLFWLSLELNAASDNNVSVLFGTDMNANGVLEREEADDQVKPPVDYQTVRANITNICVSALETEMVWLSGDSIKSKYGFSDAEMTDVLAGCLPMIEPRTDYEVSHFRLIGLLERTCGTNSIPILVRIIRDNKNDYDSWFGYSAYCAIMDMDESCFTLGGEILDSQGYGEKSRWAVYSRINRRWTKALKSGDQAFLQRCESFCLSRYEKDADFRQHVGYQRWPGPGNTQGNAQCRGCFLALSLEGCLC